MNEYPSDSIVKAANLGIDLSEQIERLAKFILEHVPGEPSESEGAVDTAIRIIKNMQKSQAALICAVGKMDEHLSALCIMARDDTLYKWNSAGTILTIHEARELLEKFKVKKTEAPTSP